MQPLTLPGPALGGWTVDVPAIREAIEFLELAWPVEVKLTSGIHTHGRIRFRDGRHLITVATNLTPAKASSTLWHELTHAAQREYLGVEAHRSAYAVESRRVGYDANRFEREAREMADAMAASVPLTKRAS